jgi:fructosamine-3-kinase
MVSTALSEAVERLLGSVLHASVRIDRARPVSGGSINRAALVELDDGRTVFLKWNPAPLPHMFELEAEGLEALAQVGVLRVPGNALAGGGNGDPAPPFLVMEAIATGAKRRGFSETFGRRFAEHHRAGRGERYGFAHDNYIGATPQPNGWSDDWVTFWRERRLGFQLDLARQEGRASSELEGLGDRLLERLDEWLVTPGDDEEPPCLLHGDLWGGNYLVDENGEPALIDPAVYYGRREADLAMTRLFGGFDARFYAGYEESWPLAPGAETRLRIYELYHLLNHLNLFGKGYLGSCLEILRRLVG